MDRINSSGYVINVSTSLTNSTGVPTPAPKTIIASTLFMSFIIGTISNGLYLWMLKFKMQRTVNTLLFFQIILSYFISTLILPLMATSFLQDNHWAFGSVLCSLQQHFVACFVGHFLLGFFLPFLVIIFCYKRVAAKTKEKGPFKSSKPFKVMLTAAISFFVCWMPYHGHSGLILTESQPLPLHLTLGLAVVTLGLAVVTISFNTVVSPILYLFTGENFKVFKKSILARFKSTFSDDSSTERTQTLNSETEFKFCILCAGEMAQ